MNEIIDIAKIYRSVGMAVICAIILVGSQSTHLLTNHYPKYTGDACWTAARSNAHPPFPMMVAMKCSIVETDDENYEVTTERTLFDFVNANRTRDISIAVLAEVLLHYILTYIS